MRIAREGCSIYLAGLVLGDLVLCVLSAVLALAVRASCFWDVDLGNFLSASILHCGSCSLPLNPGPVLRLCGYLKSTLSYLSIDDWHPKESLRSLPGVVRSSWRFAFAECSTLCTLCLQLVSSNSKDYNEETDVRTILTDCLVVGGELNIRVGDLNFRRFRASKCALN
jgi:hypothetical protein